MFKPRAADGERDRVRWGCGCLSVFSRPGFGAASFRHRRPSTSIPAASRQLRFQGIDGLRALAALAVVFHHATLISGVSQGWIGRFSNHLNVGVPIFFAISGFVLYRPFLVARMEGRKIDMRTYARKRFLRIAPAYWVALTVAAIFPTLTGVFSTEWWRYYGFLQVYDARTDFSGLPPAWTLCVEVTFYAVLPLWSIGLRRLVRARRRPMRWELAALAVLAVASLMAHGLTYEPTIAITFPWFAVGMALAVLGVYKPETPAGAMGRRPGIAWLGALVLYVVLCLYVPGFQLRWGIHNLAVMSLHTLLLAAIAALVVVPGIVRTGEHRGGHRIERLLASRSLVWTGSISYGIYLYHFPVLIGVRRLDAYTAIPGPPLVGYLLIALPVTFVLAVVSRHMIEQPALAWGARRRTVTGDRAVRRSSGSMRVGSRFSAGVDHP